MQALLFRKRTSASSTPAATAGPVLDIPPPLTFIENLHIPASPQPRRQDFVVSSRRPSISTYPLTLYCKVQAYDEWISNLSHQLVYRWRNARVIDFDEERVLIAFDGFSPRWDVWLDLNSGKVRSPPPNQGPVTYESKLYHPLQLECAIREDTVLLSTSPQLQPRLYPALSTSSSLYVEPEEEQIRHKPLFFFKRDAGISALTTTTPADAITTSSPISDTENTAVNNSHRGLSGLVNLGNSCFMNAILQSLSFVPPFAIALLECPNWENDVARELRELLREQWRIDPVHPRRPIALKLLLEKAFPHLFSPGQSTQQQDAQEFLCLLLDLLHETNNRVRRKPSFYELEEFDEVEISDEAWSLYERGNDSFVKDMFCGQFMSRKRCLHCDAKSFACDVFFDLQVPIFPPKQSGAAAAAAVKLDELLALYFKTELLTDVVCAQCKTMGGVTRQLTIERFPCVLVIMFKRSLAPNKKVQTSVSFPLRGLQIQSSNSTPRVYDLVSVVNHHGTQSMAGHYTSDLLHPLSGRWFHANDASFTPHASPPHGQIGKDAFMLFYVDTTRLIRSDFLQTISH